MKFFLLILLQKWFKLHYKICVLKTYMNIEANSPTMSCLLGMLLLTVPTVVLPFHNLHHIGTVKYLLTSRNFFLWRYPMCGRFFRFVDCQVPSSQFLQILFKISLTYCNMDFFGEGRSCPIPLNTLAVNYIRVASIALLTIKIKFLTSNNFHTRLVLAMRIFIILCS